MVVYYAKRGDKHHARATFENMRARGIEPNAFVFTSLVRAYAVAGDMRGALSCVEEMKSEGIEMTVVTYSTLISGYGKTNDAHLSNIISCSGRSADNLFKEAKTKIDNLNGIIYSNIIHAHWLVSTQLKDDERAQRGGCLERSSGQKPEGDMGQDLGNEILAVEGVFYFQQEPIRTRFCNHDKQIEQAYDDLLNSSKHTLSSMMELQEALLESNHATKDANVAYVFGQSIAISARGERPEDWVPPEDVSAVYYAKCDDIDETLPMGADGNDGIVDIFSAHSYYDAAEVKWYILAWMA
ncbi:rRNA processing protein-related [Zea mays]|uniref:rRNA processing protein-related n=1 Tax=Zea mays TaxID=4577 RepID=A0A1D6LTE3_MAIZE|nr:rRNA processing protein-related [Zea mays]